jgi:hypothetical protein
VVSSSMMFRAALVLSAVGIGLVLVNWYVKPDAWPAWTAALVMFAVMLAALRLPRLAVRSTMAVTAARSLDQITTAVVFAALMMGSSLALTLARSYGLVDGSDLARRSTGVLIGLFLAMLGNVMPKNVPPLSSGCDGARQQAFHRLAGWTWVLCGLASVVAWLVLPIDLAGTAAVVLAATAMAVTIVHLVRLAARARTKPVTD